MTATTTPLLRPRALRAGDLVVVAALSGPLAEVHEVHVERTVALFGRMGFRMRRAPLVEAGRSHWWSAATPERIAAEFNGLLRDPEVRAIVASDGGQTALGYLDLIDFDAVRADPKPVLGYSDVSLLHLVLHARTGLVGFHADMAVPGFGGSWPAAPAARQAELEALYARLLTGTGAPGPLPAGPSWECWRPGRAEGPLIGGVVNRIVLAQATRFALPPERFDGAVLFWEETGGLASHVWSYLQVLRHAGVLDRIGGMVVGVPREIAGLEPGASPTLREIVLDVLGDRDVPVLGNVDFGHAGPNLPLPVGVRAGLDAERRTLTLLEPAVAPPQPEPSG
ncbi:LD-carboxypeptidase [Kitasatospora sp. YST-16]|uniref:S66 peptidase family protein n=1 Tax=unclassified Kitasatospora TaxID=2633591 RepID=UPI0004C461FD|nr:MULTISPECIES: LD-carboxypeptidase [unclassified Kitasatospora]WAL75431.1 LD-carboxypeptidase [Kitasatospora sp. YST-16]WNW41491.1 LD-carboxypeptidase [Streptomyces sp. Li-HN-5-13]